MSELISLARGRHTWHTPPGALGTCSNLSCQGFLNTSPPGKQTQKVLVSPGSHWWAEGVSLETLPAPCSFRVAFKIICHLVRDRAMASGESPHLPSGWGLSHSRDRPRPLLPNLVPVPAQTQAFWMTSGRSPGRSHGEELDANIAKDHCWVLRSSEAQTPPLQALGQWHLAGLLCG